MLAIYDRFAPGTQPGDLATDLGPWSDTSFHLRGGLTFQSGSAAFGVASRNGLAQPWAFGPKPWVNLADNPLLSGRASWLGRLLGMTDAFAPVGGAADLTVELATLDGADCLHQPGTLAGRNQRRAGHRRQRGNLGRRRPALHGGRAGQHVRANREVTRARLPALSSAPSTRQMGGTLERDDLSAAFGGTR